MSPDFCLCNHPEASHRAGPCGECNCTEYEFDPFLEAGPDGLPRTVTDTPSGERGPKWSFEFLH